MQYVLVNNDSVLNGPRNWNYRSFENTLDEELEIQFSLPISKDDLEIIVIDENTKIYPVEMVHPNFNKKIEWLDGPFWDFSTGIAVGTYTVLPREIDHVKQDLKLDLAANRYIREISGTKITIQNMEIVLDTNRGSRDVFVQKYLLLEDSESINWKFNECWLKLSKSELNDIVKAISSHVQNQFIWEESVCHRIDFCKTLEQLDRIDIGTPLTTRVERIGVDNA